MARMTWWWGVLGVGFLVLGCGSESSEGPGGVGGDGGGGPPPRAVFAYAVNIDSETISQYRVGEDGRLTALVRPPVETGGLPVAIAAHPTRPFVYVTNSSDANVAQYRIEDDGALTPLSPPRAASGVWPYSIAFDPTGKHAYVANDFDDTVSQFRVADDGTLEALAPRTVDAGSGPIWVVVGPSGGFAYVATRVDDSVSQYAIQSDGTLAPLTPSSVGAGSAAAAVVVDPSGRFAYVANDEDDTISQYRVGTDGTLSAASPPSLEVIGRPQSLTIDPLGRALYAGYLFADAASHHAIEDDGTLGTLSPAVEGAGEGSWPASVAIDPSGSFAYVIDASSDKILHYDVRSDGALLRSATPDATADARPSAMVVVDLEDRTDGAGGAGGMATTATIGGVVYVDEGFTQRPVPGATVYVGGTSVSARSDRNGHFWVEAPLGEGEIYSAAPGHWGTRTSTDVNATGSNRYDVEVIPDADIEEIVGSIGVPLDPEKGLVLLELGNQRSAEGGESADLAVPYGEAVVYDRFFEPRVGNELAFEDEPFVVFVNVDPSADVGLVATNGDGTRCPEDPAGAANATYPKVLTEIAVTCPPRCPPGVDCVACTKLQRVGVGCENNVVNILSSLPFQLSVDADRPIYGGQPFNVTLGGAAVFPAPFFDIAQGVIPGGVQQVILESTAVTVAVRRGATGPEVPLRFDESRLTPGRRNFCTILPEQGQCNPFLDVDPGDPTAGNPACTPMIAGNYCDPDPKLLVDIPTSDDCCAPGGGCACEQLGKLDQCVANGFCVTSGLFVALASTSATYTADTPGDEVLFGWWEDPATDPIQPSSLSVCTGTAATDDPRCQSTGGELPDGAYALPFAVYGSSTEPIGLRADIGGTLSVALQCAMAEDGGSCSTTNTLGCLVDDDCPAGELCEGVGVDDNVLMPTPDDRMLSCPIY